MGVRRNIYGPASAGSLAATFSALLTPTATKAANYTLAANDLVPFDLTGGSLNGTLPTTPADKTQVFAYIKTFSPGRVLTLTAGGSDVIETAAGTAATATRSTGAGESIYLQYDHANAVWRQLPDRIPMSTLTSVIPQALSWQPPVLVNPILWTPANTNYASRFLDAQGRDVYALMPSVAQTNLPGQIGCMRIDNARNVIIMGGQLSVPLTTGNEAQRMGIVFNACTGTLHVEGVKAGSLTEYMTDFIDVYASPTATLQVQNCDATVQASDPVNFTDGHPDIIFTDNTAGAQTLGALRIDRLHGSTDYQGISNFSASCSVDARRVWINVREEGQAATSQVYWQKDNTDTTVYTNCWLTKRASQTYGLSVHPDSSDGTNARRPSVSGSNFITWPSEPTITGGIQGGIPPAGFITADVGIGYVPRSPVVTIPAQYAVAGPSTIIGNQGTGTTSVGVSNQARYQVWLSGGTISSIMVSVTTASGNISVATYTATGLTTAAVPVTRKATSGAIACPASGVATVSLGGSVTVFPGEFAALSADNTSAIFAQTSSAAVAGLCGGLSYIQSTAHPCPASAGTVTANLNAFQMRGVT